MARFGIGFAPSGGEALLRVMKQKHPEKVLEASGLFSKDERGRLYDRFSRRVMFPIANESGKIVAFGGTRDRPRLAEILELAETPIYSKSNVLFIWTARRNPYASVILPCWWKVTWTRFTVALAGNLECGRQLRHEALPNRK